MDTTSKHHHPHRHSHRRRCILISVASLLALAVLLLILGLTVFRVRHTTTTVNAVHLSGFHVGLNVLNLSVDLNVTLDLDVTATNPNHASFKYSGGGAELRYRGVLAGEAAIPPGEVAAEGSVRMNVTLTVFAGRLISDSELYSDVISGSVVFTTDTTIPGRVTVLGIFKHHLVTYSTCNVTVGVRNQTVQNSDCSYRSKL